MSSESTFLISTFSNPFFMERRMLLTEGVELAMPFNSLSIMKEWVGSLKEFSLCVVPIAAM